MGQVSTVTDEMCRHTKFILLSLAMKTELTLYSIGYSLSQAKLFGISIGRQDLVLAIGIWDGVLLNGVMRFSWEWAS